MVNLADEAYLMSLLLGALVGVGFFVAVLGCIRVRVKDRSQKQIRLRQFAARGSTKERRKQFTTNLVQVSAAGAFALGAWYVTGWFAAAAVAGASGWMIPLMTAAPARRQRMTDEIEAYSQWTEQVRDLVSASGSLFEAVGLSATNAPEMIRPTVEKMAEMVRTVGLTQALDWFAEESGSPFADRLVLGMKIAWDSGARVTESFENTAKSMRAEVEMRRRNEVANKRSWTQVVSMLVVTMLAVLFMFTFNRGYFDPFGTVVGQTVLLAVGGLIFGNVLWVLKLSEAGLPIRLLYTDGEASGPEMHDDESLVGGGQA